MKGGLLQRFLSTSCLCVATGVMALAVVGVAQANPVDGVVVGGAATIATNGTTLDIHQSTDKVVIDWRSFNIATGEHTQFYQPSSNALAVNRVNDMNPSVIAGSLSANGNVVLVNPNGVFFSSTSTVDVNGLIATTANISNANAMAGNLNFDQAGNPNATIENQGTITAQDAGLVGLVAPHVINSGVINAHLGRVQLASGDTATVDLYGDGLMEVAVSDAVASQLVENTGVINAPGGTIALTAAAGREMVNSVIKVSGELRAPSVGMRNGKIIIVAAGSNAVAGNNAADKGKKSGYSTVLIDHALLDVSGKNTGETGGTVTITGDHIALMDGAVIDATGANGGGVVHVGGAYLGQGPTPTAEITIMQTAARIDASALVAGKGGEVIMYADERTEFGGSIDASGAGENGDGGFVETSGRHALLAFGNVRIIAGRNGRAGTWLLDPADITITAATNTSNTGNPNFTATATASQVSAASIKTNLDAGTNVTITTSNDGFAGNGDIFVSSAITTTGGGALTLSAYRNITVSSTITLQGGALTLRSNNAGAADGSTGAGAVSVTAAIATNGGNITIGGGSGAIMAGSGYALGNSALVKGVSITAAVSATGGNIIINGRGYNTTTDSNYGFHNTAAISTTGAGTIAINGLGSGNTNSSLDYGAYIVSGITTVNGALTINGTGGGAGVAANNYGIVFSSGGGFAKTTGSGNITLVGNGGVGSGGANHGININVANGVQTTGTGTISLTGIGGTNGSNNFGVVIGVSSAGSVTAAGGAISIGGTGGVSTANGNHGIYLGAAGGAAGTVSNTGNGTITINGTAGGASSNSAGNHGVIVNNGSIVSTVNGTLSVTGIGGGAGTGTANYGVYVLTANSTIKTTGTGALNVTGTGGNASGSGSSNFGVASYVASGIQTTGTGAMTIIGTGGSASGTGTDSYGISVGALNGITSNSGTMTFNGYGGAGAGVNAMGIIINGAYSISSTSGDIIMNGFGGNGSSNSHGVYLLNAGQINTGVSGTISITGNGGTGANTAGNDGVKINSGSIVSTVNGTLTVIGTGGGAGTGTNNYGVYVVGASSSIKTTGSGALAITGTGGNTGGSGGANHGIYVNIANGIQTTGTGNITVSATKGGQATSYGTFFDVINAVISGGTAGNITMLFDTKSWSGAVANTSYNLNSIGSLTIAPLTAITMGVGSGAGTLSFTDTYIGYTTAASYIFGSTTAGDLTINTARDFGTKNVTFISGGNITLAGTLTKATGAGTATYLLQANGNITNSGSAGMVASTGAINLTLTSDNDVSGAGSITLTTAPLTVNGGTITLNSNGQAVTQSGSIGGDETINSSNGAVSIGVLNGDAAGTRSLTVNAGTATFTTTGAIGGTNRLNNLTISADDVVLGANMSGSGTLTLQPTSTNRVIRINNGVANGTNLNLSTTELGYLVDGWAGINIGRTDAVSPAYTYIGNSTWNDPVTFRSWVKSVVGTITGAGNASLTFAAIGPGTGGTELNGGGSIITANQNIIFAGYLSQYATNATISSNGGNITVASYIQPQVVNIGTVSFNSGGGDISIQDIRAGAVTSGSFVLNAGTGTVTVGSTVNTLAGVTVSGATITAASAWGATTALGAVSLTSTNSLTLPSITASSIFARTTGATSDITIAAGKTLAASGVGTAITLASARNLINSSGSATPFTLSGGGRFVVYSTNPAADTLGAMTGAFVRYGCTYGGACPAGVTIPATGNGFVYTVRPTLTITPTALAAMTYGDAIPSMVGYGYSISGYLTGAAGADSGTDGVSGTLTGTTSYTVGSNVGSYNVDYSSGSLASTLGYQFTYANNASAITVNKAALVATANGQSITYGASVPSGSVTYSGFVLGETSAVIDTLATLASAQSGTPNAGTYAGNYTASGAVDGNYSFSYVAGDLVVGKAALVATANGQSITYGASVPSGSVTYSGFVLGETSAVIDTLATLASAQSGTPNAGTYMGNYTASGAVDGNYNFSYVAGDLVVDSVYVPPSPPVSSLLPPAVEHRMQVPPALPTWGSPHYREVIYIIDDDISSDSSASYSASDAIIIRVSSGLARKLNLNQAYFNAHAA